MSHHSNEEKSDVLDAMFHRYRELTWLQRLLFPSVISRKFSNNKPEINAKNLNDWQKDKLKSINWSSLPWYNRFFGQFFASVRAFARSLKDKPAQQNSEASAVPSESLAEPKIFTEANFFALFTPKAAEIHVHGVGVEKSMVVINNPALLPIWHALAEKTAPVKEIHYNNIMQLAKQDNALLAIKKYVETNMDNLFSKKQKTELQAFGFWQSADTNDAAKAHASRKKK